MRVSSTCLYLDRNLVLEINSHQGISSQPQGVEQVLIILARSGHAFGRATKVRLAGRQVMPRGAFSICTEMGMLFLHQPFSTATVSITP